MSRMLTTTITRPKKLNRELNGTTEEVGWVKDLGNVAVDEISGLATKVDSGIINRPS